MNPRAHLEWHLGKLVQDWHVEHQAPEQVLQHGRADVPVGRQAQDAGIGPWKPQSLGPALPTLVPYCQTWPRPVLPGLAPPSPTRPHPSQLAPPHHPRGGLPSGLPGLAPTSAARPRPSWLAWLRLVLPGPAPPGPAPPCPIWPRPSWLGWPRPS